MLYMNIFYNISIKENIFNLKLNFEFYLKIKTV